VATGPLFFLLASFEQPWWVAGAWLVWSAFAGLNICLPNLNIKFSTPETRPATFALYYALTSLAYAVSTLLSGGLYELLRYESFYVGPWLFDVYGFIFYLAFATRLMGLIFILGIDEPGAVMLLPLLGRVMRGKRVQQSIAQPHPLD
jgi:hypothetical protein